MRLCSVHQLVVAAALILPALSLKAQNASNPIEDALLRWYPANLATLLPAHNTCIGPQSLAFDGAHLWVGCYGSFEIDEYNVSDGSFVRSVPLGANSSASPGFLLYDGANIWVTNPVSGAVMEVQASSGSIVRTVAVGNNPTGMTFDGTYIWVANSGSNSLTKVQVSNGATTPINISSFCTAPRSLIYVASDPGSLAYGGLSSSIWVTCNTAPNGPAVVELNPANPFVAVSTTSIGGNSPYCNNMAYDGLSVWLTSTTPAALWAINTTNHSPTQFTLTTNSQPTAVAFDGLYMWIANGSSSVDPVANLNPSIGIPSYFETGGGTAAFVAFDGGNIWVANPDAVANGGYTISKL